MSLLSISGIKKVFDGRTVLEDINLDVQEGEFFSLLGPSGCGKTTLLRIIAGLEYADGGMLNIAGRDVTGKSPQGRNIGFVFQNYALFPNMSVSQNVAYGLKVKKLSKTEIARKVDSVLDQLQLTGKADLNVTRLSGGEQQRVALARVVVTEPQLILFDEPLSNLDLMLRAEARVLLKQLQKGLGITSIFVTHDQSEALALSDRIGIMNLGEIVQTGTPKEVYFHPDSKFAADFVGHYNLFTPKEAASYIQHSVADNNIVGCLPEHLELTLGDSNIFISEVQFNGLATEYFLKTDTNEELKAISFAARTSLKRDDRVLLTVSPENLKAFTW